MKIPYQVSAPKLPRGTMIASTDGEIYAHNQAIDLKNRERRVRRFQERQNGLYEQRRAQFRMPLGSVA